MMDRACAGISLSFGVYELVRFIGFMSRTLFSTSATPMQSDAIFKDPYARMITAQCGSIADSNLNVFDIMYNRGI